MNQVQNLQALAIALGNVSRSLDVRVAAGEKKESLLDLAELEVVLTDMVVADAMKIIPKITQ